MSQIVIARSATAAAVPAVRPAPHRRYAGLVAGVAVKVVQEMLGHSSAALTLDIYSHVLPHMQDEAADRVEGMLRGQFAPQAGEKAVALSVS